MAEEDKNPTLDATYQESNFFQNLSYCTEDREQGKLLRFWRSSCSFQRKIIIAFDTKNMSVPHF